MSARLEAAQAALAGIVPTGKNLMWVVGLIAFSAVTGFGFAFRVGDTAENIEAIPEIKTAVIGNSQRLDVLEDRIEDNESINQQILCYVRIIANGEDPGTELNPRCPNPNRR